MIDLLIIGGGAAGLAAAIAAAECGDRVLILERMDRIGKKILATGNGRCNLMNTGAPSYPGGTGLAEAVLERMGARRQKLFWEAHGLRLREEDAGRVYPACGQATAVLDTIRQTLACLNVKILTEKNVDAVAREKDGWSVLCGSERFRSRRVLIAGGGMAQEKLGSNGSCYSLLKQLGIAVGKPRPVLTQIETETSPIRGLSGIRTKGRVEIWRHGQLLHAETGEILFADYGISGVCTMQCARYAAKGCTAILRLCRGLGLNDRNELSDELQRRKQLWPDEKIESLFTGLCVPRLGMALLKAAGIRDMSRPICRLSSQEIHAISEAADQFTLDIIGVKGFATAQVCAGGALTDQFSADNLECIQQKGLFAAGEVLDVDGDCGGFNLMFAFGSGLLSGLDNRPAPWEKNKFFD